MCGENLFLLLFLFLLLGSPPRVRGKPETRPEVRPVARITPACAGKTMQELKIFESSEDHPRVCGENFPSRGHISPSPGSPPRVRGKPGDTPRRRLSPRITPACAGKTNGFYLSCCISWDHPRVCGENRFRKGGKTYTEGSPPRVRGKLFFLKKWLTMLGSPPRVRGKHAVKKSFPDSIRITPACAGKTLLKAPADLLVKDHPRVCGENRFSWMSAAAHVGSPPRVRGKHHAAVEAHAVVGITPACAGKTCKGWREPRRAEDHPRVCGENCSYIQGYSDSRGSPPRVRGKPRCAVQSVRSVGITPACAGKTYTRDTTETAQEDHPRVCGENLCLCDGLIIPRGSPPRVRGKLDTKQYRSIAQRITPACAGKTFRVCAVLAALWDHPRVCGENSFIFSILIRSSGSPPRVRGKHDD
ncbi:hypothetical protein HMPREF9623_01556 [Stomatobaculum longum]|uniref:Uncharacterized protein n=1 Tax=Stomatobaculum longum TaxID=796942 RepID=A0AA36Y3W9_9FIRM|nr:hypothetical protein HMPREF9623_01556 [Stomatobaculum longum]